MLDDPPPQSVRLLRSHKSNSLLRNSKTSSSHRRPLQAQPAATRKRCQSVCTSEKGECTATRTQEPRPGDNSPQRPQPVHQALPIHFRESVDTDPEIASGQNYAQPSSPLGYEEQGGHFQGDRRSIHVGLEKVRSEHSVDQDYLHHDRPHIRQTTISYEVDDATAEEHTVWILVRISPCLCAEFGSLIR